MRVWRIASALMPSERLSVLRSEPAAEAAIDPRQAPSGLAEYSPGANPARSALSAQRPPPSKRRIRTQTTCSIIRSGLKLAAGSAAASDSPGV